MNLDNCAFLGDYDDHYEVRLLNGDILPIRVNMLNEEKLCQVIVDAACEVGIVFREHRVEVVPPTDDNPYYLVFQQPVKGVLGTMIVDYGDIVELGLNGLTPQKHLDFLDYCLENTRKHVNETRVFVTWENVDWMELGKQIGLGWPCTRLVVRSTYSCNGASQLTNFLKGFGEVAGDRVAQLCLDVNDTVYRSYLTPDDITWEVLDTVVTFFPALTDLELPVSTMYHVRHSCIWGEKLFELAHLNRIHIPVDNRDREHLVTCWAAWRLNWLYIHDRPGVIACVDMTRWVPDEYGEVLANLDEL